MLLVRSHAEMKVMLLKIGEALVSNKLGYLVRKFLSKVLKVKQPVSLL